MTKNDVLNTSRKQNTYQMPTDDRNYRRDMKLDHLFARDHEASPVPSRPEQVALTYTVVCFHLLRALVCIGLDVNLTPQPMHIAIQGRKTSDDLNDAEEREKVPQSGKKQRHVIMRYGTAQDVKEGMAPP